jgi:hypothetical protein
MTADYVLCESRTKILHTYFRTNKKDKMGRTSAGIKKQEYTQNSKVKEKETTEKYTCSSGICKIRLVGQGRLSKMPDCLAAIWIF